MPCTTNFPIMLHRINYQCPKRAHARCELDSIENCLLCHIWIWSMVVFVLSPLNQTVDIKMNITYLPLALISCTALRHSYDVNQYIFLIKFLSTKFPSSFVMLLFTGHKLCLERESNPLQTQSNKKKTKKKKMTTATTTTTKKTTTASANDFLSSSLLSENNTIL